MLLKTNGVTKIKVGVAEVALIVSVLTALFSIYTFNKSLPLSAANLIFSEDQIEVTFYTSGTEDILDDKVSFIPIIKNIGYSPAYKVHFEAYTIFEPENVFFNKKDNDIVKQFSDELVHPLQPGSTASFGEVISDRFFDTGDKGQDNFDLIENRIGLILVYSLKYKHDRRLLPFLKKTERKCYAFRYTFGSDKVRTLIKTDLEKVIPRINNYESKKGEICESL